MAILITICARGGSKGIPGKNIKKLNGIPLIAYTIYVAKAFVALHDGIIAISTDSVEIKKAAAEFGINTNYTRPAHLATDAAGKVDAIKDLVFHEEKVNQITFEYVLDLDVTSPLRTIDDLNLAFDALKADGGANNLFSVSNAARNPYFNMVEKKLDGYYGLCKKLDSVILSRQAAPKVYDINGSFYFYNRSFFDSDFNSVLTDNTLIHVIEHMCFDLDHPIDFEFMEYLLANNKLDFEMESEV
ncbi:acylneuraminate cytidylyltransferase family protein [Mucilaginibacter flavidus]|uniref:acylneuraminate cytidylyltransferase family protein n=1 Tax=Mucilaginibacter flavidus TaxID=2949309 RepID=UPI002093A678|nr:acylneuraminate cytidylyltransferase family protein [Mucilaginibacter flavidus]MCO5949293.1 acylneuraminate cytidylyltransferase family protein [Mucilaginibacter flavidus]